MRFDIKRAIVEFIGTYSLVLIFLMYPLPLVTGIVITLLLVIGSYISYEVHYNPILSTIRVLINKLSVTEYISTIFFQFLGGSLAFLTHKYYNNIK